MALPHFQGIFPPLVTPLSAPDKLDVAGLERLIEHVLSGGVHGLFILGTTGEAPSLDHNLRKELIQRTCRQVRDRVPVLVGITDTAIVEARKCHASRRTTGLRRGARSALLLSEQPDRTGRVHRASRSRAALPLVPLQHADPHQDDV